MKIVRAIASGILVWALILSVFIATSFIPAITQTAMLQWLVVGAFIVPFAWIGAALYYRKNEVVEVHGLFSGSIMLTTALLLDALITVPFIEIPYNGSSYTAFFSNPMLWVLVAENIAVIYFYWKTQIASNQKSIIKIK